MNPTTILLVVLATLISIEAAPYSSRLRRALEEEAQEKEAASIKDKEPSEPVTAKTRSGRNHRQNKALSYFDFLPQLYSGEDDYGDDDLLFDPSENVEEDSLSRTIPSRRKQNPYKSGNNGGGSGSNGFTSTNSIGYENSPIYYIRLPPTPYMFVPGLGYVSQPPSIGPPIPPPVNPFINLPIEFVSNGKPTNIYQWTGAPTYQDNYNSVYSRPSRPNDYNNYQRPQKKPVQDSKVTNLKKGPYVFNGKPNDIFVLRDSYNSLYSDALQNFYP